MTFSHKQQMQAKEIKKLCNKDGNIDIKSAWAQIKAAPNKFPTIRDEFEWDQNIAADLYNESVLQKLIRRIPLWETEETEIPLVGPALPAAPNFVLDQRNGHHGEYTPLSRVALVAEEQKRTLEHRLLLVRNSIYSARKVITHFGRAMEMEFESRLREIVEGVDDIHATKETKRPPKGTGKSA